MTIDWSNPQLDASLVSGVCSLIGTSVVVVAGWLASREAARRADLAKAEADRCRLLAARKKRRGKPMIHRSHRSRWVKIKRRRRP